MIPIDDVLRALDLCGVVVFAVSGGLKAAEKEMDVFGFMLLACITGIGGGTLRDLLLGIRPVFWVEQVEYPALCALTGAATFLLAGRLPAGRRWLEWADAVGLATFCVVGTEIARSTGAPPLAAVLMGVITAAFGGLLRDLLCGEIPLILRREIYATAAAAGSIVYLVSRSLIGDSTSGLVLGFIVALCVRGAGLQFGLSLPTHRPRR